jgi:hypothetical protein
MWAPSVLASSSSIGTASLDPFAGADEVVGGAWVTIPSRGTDGAPRVPPAAPHAEEGLGHVLELARGRSAVHHDILQEAVSTLGRLGEELVDVDVHLESENLRLAREWYKLNIAINLGCQQHERACTEAAESLVTSHEACAHALEEARATDHRHKAAEEREKELQALNAAHEQRVQAR